METNLLFIDTSAFYAFLDRSDAYHDAMAHIFRKSSAQFVTSNYILDELITLFRVRGIGLHQFAPFVTALWREELCRIIRITSEIDERAWTLMQQFHDQRFSFTDCASFALMREYGIRQACTLDKHFRVAGFETIGEH